MAFHKFTATSTSATVVWVQSSANVWVTSRPSGSTMPNSFAKCISVKDHIRSRCFQNRGSSTTGSADAREAYFSCRSRHFGADIGQSKQSSATVVSSLSFFMEFGTFGQRMLAVRSRKTGQCWNSHVSHGVICDNLKQ